MSGILFSSESLIEARSEISRNQGAEILELTAINGTIPISSGDGNEIFNLSAGERLTIEGFGGVGSSDTPSQTVLEEVDTLVFNGTDLVASNLQLIQQGSDLIVSFAVPNSPQVKLTNFSIEDFDNLTLNSEVVANIHFDGQSLPLDEVDVIVADATPATVARENVVTFLNDLDNTVEGSNSPDVIIGQLGNDILLGNQGDDLLRGGRGQDILVGGLGSDTLEGDEGGDGLFGKVNNDTIYGGDGNDTIGGGRGNDILEGGDGNDTLKGKANDDTLFGGNGDDTLEGGTGDDSLSGQIGNDILLGNDGDDSLGGGQGDDQISGSRGRDQLRGGQGNDDLSGGKGIDVLEGGDGDDILAGGRKADTLTGGTGGDTFRYEAFDHSLLDNGNGISTFDIITDLVIGTDLIESVNSVSASNVVQTGDATSLDEVGIQAVLTASSFATNGAATFSFDSRTFLALNDSVAGYQQSNDAVIEITGYSGDLADLAIST